jgi:amino acid adenylation domain-containing protein
MTTIESTLVPATVDIDLARPPREAPGPADGIGAPFITIHQIFQEQAARTPEATALVLHDKRMTYAELNARADKIAELLVEFGIGRDVPVGICLERSFEMVVGLLGILKAGGCYVPLDPAYPTERLKFMIENSAAPLVLGQRKLAERFQSEMFNSRLLCIEEACAPTHAKGMAIKGRAKDHVRHRSHPNDLAYIIYTSGSTGQPKGVMVTHGNLVNLFAGMDRVIGAEAGVWLAVTSISFDISALELFWTLARGFTVVIHTEGADPKSIMDQILEHKVTHIQCTPSLAGSLVRTPDSRQALSQLCKFLVGGEALPSSTAAQLRELLRGDLLNMYGPTETTVWSAAHLVREVNGSVPIGRPIINTQIYILAEGTPQPVGTGEAGEIFIGGAGVARGYLNQPELTAQKFVADPFNPDPRARLYRTGDIGRCRADGTIEFLGRADHQVKLHGHRIELGEIESILRQHNAVQECVVHVWQAGPDDKRLAAYLVPTNGSMVSAAELRRLLESKLPSYMVPSAFVWLAQMPLTPNGKIDRNALPSPEEVHASPATSYLPPRTQIEEIIAGIWQRILRVERVGRHDSFFELGGNSLLLIETHMQLCRALHDDFPIARLFELPTIAALAEFLASGKKTSLPGVQARAARQREAFARPQPRTV